MHKENLRNVYFTETGFEGEKEGITLKRFTDPIEADVYLKGFFLGEIAPRIMKGEMSETDISYTSCYLWAVSAEKYAELVAKPLDKRVISDYGCKMACFHSIQSWWEATSGMITAKL